MSQVQIAYDYVAADYDARYKDLEHKSENIHIKKIWDSLNVEGAVSGLAKISLYLGFIRIDL